MRFLRSLLIWIKLYKMGYNLSGLWTKCPGGDYGFYRLNYSRNGVEEHSILDVDFQVKGTPRNSCSHIHGGKEDGTIFRVEGNNITRSASPRKSWAKGEG